MDIEEFLIRNLVDSFYQYSEVVLDKSAEEIDELYMQVDGTEMTDKEFVIEYFDDVYDDEIVDSLYGTILDFSLVGEVDINKIVAFLASKYYVFNYLSDSSVVSFFKLNSLEKIVELFRENYDFGMAMLKAYFKSLVDENTYDNNRKIIYDKGDQGRLLELEQENIEIKIRTINNLLRDVVCNIYNHYIENGCEDIEALNNTWMFFFKDFDPLGELDEMGMDVRTKTYYKSYLLCLIYADLYEDVCNDSIINSDNYEDRMADVVPLISMQVGEVGIPTEEGIRNRLLKHFILLQKEEKKIEENRKRTYKDDRIKELKKFNPFYKLDELKFK